MESVTPLEPSSSTTVLAAGELVDRYVVERLIHRSDTAEVYRVRHTTLGIHRALKVVTEGGAVSWARLEREARVLAELAHPNVIPVHDVLDVRGHPALLLDDLEGSSLRDRLDLGPIRLDDALALFRGIVAGVAAAHERGVLHRDLTPDAVWLTRIDGALVAQIADFGVARGPAGAGHAPTNVTAPGLVVGTPGYVAPECLAGRAPADARSDIFSLGCVLYELVCGVAPFRRPTVVQTQLANFTAEFTAPERLAPGLPGPVRETLLRCLAADPERRPQSCAAVLACLQAPVPPRFVFADAAAPLDRLTRVPASPRPAPPAARGASAAPTKRLLAGLLGVGGLALAAGALTLRSSPDDVALGVAPPEPLPTTAPERQTDGGGTTAHIGDVAAPGVAPDAGAGDGTPTGGAASTGRGQPQTVFLPRPGAADAPTPGAPVAAASVPAASVTAASVTAEGATAVWLLQGDQRYATGAIAPGTYTILASFAGAAPVDAGHVRVAAGDSVHLRCNPAFLQCRP